MSDDEEWGEQWDDDDEDRHEWYAERERLLECIHILEAELAAAKTEIAELQKGHEDAWHYLSARTVVLEAELAAAQESDRRHKIWAHNVQQGFGVEQCPVCQSSPPEARESGGSAVDASQQLLPAAAKASGALCICGHAKDRHASEGCWGTRDAEAARVWGEDCSCLVFTAKKPLAKEAQGREE